MTTAADLEKVISGPGTKADRARKLFALGCDRTDAVELLSMSYSQAHSIWKGIQGGRQDQAGVVARATASIQRRNSTNSEGDLDSPTGALRDHQRTGRSYGRLQLSPTQVRVLTQDGHQVIKVDKEGGTVCRNCAQPLAFSLKWLGFVHKFSKADPTNVEDRYE